MANKNQSTPPPSIPEGKKIVERTRPDGNREWVVRNDSGCWVATAYYGDAYHADVVTLRQFRDHLMELSFLGAVVRAVNAGYYRMGRTNFAQWWRNDLKSGSRSSLPRIVSKLLLRSLLWLASSALTADSGRDRGPVDQN